MSGTSSMHVKASEAIGKLDKIKWANMKADERLKILEKIRDQLADEMEDLGVEEAEQRNVKIGTQDDLYTADACRLTSVVPLAFEIYNCIELYKANIAGKPLDPVSVTKVDNSMVDEINFGGSAKARAPQNGAEGMPPPPNAPPPDAPPPPAPDASEHSVGVDDEIEPESKDDEVAGQEIGEDSTKALAAAEAERVAGEETPENDEITPENDEIESERGKEESPQAEEKDDREGAEDTDDKDDGDEVAADEKDSDTEESPQKENDENKENNGDEAAAEKEDEASENAEEPTTDKPLENGESIVTDDDAEQPTNGEKDAETEENPDDVQINVVFPEFEGAKADFVPVNPNEIFHDVLVSPRTWTEKGYFNARQDRLRITGDPNMPDCRIGPYDRRDPQATAILGAGSYSAAPEIIKATFLGGHVVVYKPHPNNADIDRIFSEIMKPLVEAGALSFCTHDQGPDLVKHDGIDQIYMIGSSETAQEILRATEKPCILQTGSVNPVIIVPSLDREWGVREMRHHALQIATAGKHNGGHFCGRPQVIVTSKSWSQREQFLQELEEALSTRTPPEGSYDAKYRKVFQHFVDMYPDGKVIRQEGVDTSAADVLLITGCSPKDFYGLQNEAFCQVFMEVCLDAIDHPLTFLPAAVKFCNDDLYGSLCATIVIDDQTNQDYEKVVEKALSDLQYGTVSTNVMACVGWTNPYLFWGSYKKNVPQDEASRKDDEYFGHFQRGAGHFGNLLGYKDATKSIITDKFTGKGHFIKTCRGAYNGKIAALSSYAIEGTWKKLSAYKLKGVRAAAARKDW